MATRVLGISTAARKACLEECVFSSFYIYDSCKTTAMFGIFEDIGWALCDF